MKIKWNEVTWYSKILAIILFAIVFYLGFYLGKEWEKVNKITIENIKSTDTKVLLKDGRQCYSYNHEATGTEPYTVNELMDITINNGVVNGVKNGTQSGPDMTNGYSGTLLGNIDGDTINTIFSYTIEGSQGKEEEIYKMKKDKTGIEKLRYPLVEKDGMLVPDTTKEFKTQFYARAGCTSSN